MIELNRDNKVHLELREDALSAFNRRESDRTVNLNLFISGDTQSHGGRLG